MTQRQDNSSLVPWVLAIAVLVMAGISLTVGPEPINIVRAVQDLFSNPTSLEAIILREIRLPRTLVGLTCGATLGICGAAMQGLLRNPLASPGLIGSASGAALGAVVVLYFGANVLHPLWIPMAGMFGSLIATVLVYVLAGRGASITTLILSGVAINALATAGISLLLNLAPSPYAVQELVHWTLGDLGNRSLKDFYIMLPCTLVGWALFIGIGKQLDALTLGERTAFSLGVNPQHIRWRVFIGASLAVGAAISATGMIGFIGLVVPHLLRPWVGFQPGKLLWVSGLGGSALLLAADIVVRLIETDIPVKVGVITSLVGAPFFLHLIIRSRRDGLAH